MKKSGLFHHGKRDVKKKITKKIFLIRIICIFILLLILSFMCYHFLIKPYKQKPSLASSMKNVENDTVQPVEDIQVPEPEPVIKEDEKVDSSYLPEKMGKYNVIGELVIDKVGVKNNILDVDDPNDEKAVNGALDLSVVKFYGPDINTVGNFSITGHNYNGLLKRVKELEVNDTFYLINKATGTKVNYQIYNIYSCDPYDTTCLDDPQEDNVREVTLITCNKGGFTRLICKAKEI